MGTRLGVWRKEPCEKYQVNTGTGVGEGKTYLLRFSIRKDRKGSCNSAVGECEEEL